MSMRRRTGMVAIALTLMMVVGAPGPSWGQTDERIGTVLAVDGTATVQAANTTTREPLQFRAALFQNDTVRTGADSKVKVLLRDESIMTLAENGELQFTEFLLNPDANQRRTIVSLTLGKLRVLTTKIFGAGSATEVRTANTVAGVRGTTFVVIFIPPDETDVIALDGVVAVRNPNLPQLEPVPANFRTQVIGNSAPSRAAELPPSDRQALEVGLRLTEQIPAEIKPSSERQAAGPIRGEPSTVASAPLLTPQPPSVTALSSSAQLVQQDAAAQLNQLVSRTATVNTATSPEPTQTRGTPVITPDNVQAATTVQQRQSPNLRLTISFPR